MQNHHKGFIVPLIIAIVIIVSAAIVIATKVHQPVTSNNTTPSVVSPSTNTSTTSSKILPENGAVFNYGDTLTIKWDPAMIDVSTIYIVNLHPQFNEAKSYQIYRRASLSDGVSTSGTFAYKIPANYSIDPGQYQVELYSFGETNKVVLPGTFLIQSPTHAATRSTTMFYVNRVVFGPLDAVNAPSNFSPNSSLMLSVDARDGNGLEASANDGFDVQATIKNTQGVIVSTMVSQFSPNISWWLINGTTPTVPGTYTVDIELYCAQKSLNSTCAQKYPSEAHSNKVVTFTVSS